MVFATTIACGIALAKASPAMAGTVLRGKVSLPTTVPAKAGELTGSRDPIHPSDVVVYITVKPGSGTPRLAGRGARVDVELEGDGFSPSSLAITARSKVRFRNRDRVYHSLFTVTAAGRSELGSFAPGERREVRFDRPGVNHLFCQLHPAAAAFVVVCPNWFHTRATEAGDYVLPPLPRGVYLIHAWHPRLGETQRPVKVSGRDVVRFDLSI